MPYFRRPACCTSTRPSTSLASFARSQLPQLQADFAPPPLCSLGKLQHINAWLGPGGTVTPCHFDSYDNVFAQV